EIAVKPFSEEVGSFLEPVHVKRTIGKRKNALIGGFLISREGEPTVKIVGLEISAGCEQRFGLQKDGVRSNHLRQTQARLFCSAIWGPSKERLPKKPLCILSLVHVETRFPHPVEAFCVNTVIGIVFHVVLQH